MTITEKVAYLKGLLEGKGVEDKEMNLIVEILTDLANDLADLEDYTAELTEQVDAVDEDLNTLEEDFYDEWDDDEDCDCCDCDCCDCDEEYYDVTCPSCNEDFEVDEDTLLDGGVECPNCGEHLEFDFDDEEIEDEE
ncbi:MAG: hypothetical protein E7527_03865 [Ruminococcaceae bacterium]|nr:hypothetical protein [Oscillospiraceae bacterium]